MRHESIPSQPFYEQAYTYAPIGIALVSLEGEWLQVNPELCRMIGYTEEELAALSLDDLTYPDDLPAGPYHRKELIEDRASSCSLEKRYFRKDGSLLWASLHVSLAREEKTGEPLYYILHLIDISEKKAAESELQDTGDFYRLMLENARDVITYSRADGTMLYCSPPRGLCLGMSRRSLSAAGT
ncbi:PAS domain S-box protein [Paenibacillus sp. CC-CFT747]|nr:PAS domain S-box protein [Paenibacillus sp. CC-CFT747]